MDYRRPVCTPQQSCSYEAFGILFALCDCPEENSMCPHDEKNAVEHRGTSLQFCSPRIVPICENEEISTTVAGIQTAIHCICPEDSELVQQPSKIKDVTDYICRQVIYLNRCLCMCVGVGVCTFITSDPQYSICPTAKFFARRFKLIV
ncbi:unnamed protein product [Angiostrongylus costaricensis]|uniref:EB domain-containing protein n=1 Tax=Angiostrongylus costaricensis TaxID=334426 RepID=A0A0R3PS59_ANGCS|nr:unnamed protein product [Angiostrongylus costaricensis]